MQNRFAKKVDRSQSSIIKTVRQMGGQVYATNFGNDFPDLLIGWRGAWRLWECKELDGSFSIGQLRFLAHADAHVDIVTGEEDAIVSLNSDRRITDIEQEAILDFMFRTEQESIRVKKLLGMMGR